MPTDVDDLIIATLEGPNTPPSDSFSETPPPAPNLPNPDGTNLNESGPTPESVGAIPSQGPAFFYQRRDEWVKGDYRPSQGGRVIADKDRQTVQSSAGTPGSGSFEPRTRRSDNGPLARLGEVLSRPQAIEDEEVWEDYLKSIHARLVGGSRLRKGMSLAHAVKILHAGWLRDGTWTGAPEMAQFSSTSNPTSVSRANQTLRSFRTIPGGQPSHTYAANVALGCPE